MTQTISFLAFLGAEASTYSTTSLDTALLNAELDESVKQALLARDYTALEHLLGVRSKVVCAVIAPQEEPDEPDDQPEKTPEEEQPDKESQSLKVA